MSKMRLPIRARKPIAEKSGTRHVGKACAAGVTGVLPSFSLPLPLARRFPVRLPTRGHVPYTSDIRSRRRTSQELGRGADIVRLGISAGHLPETARVGRA